jgi:4-amino-4-deoxy-L-arabinose transferase-like glycosyltransferase
MILFKRILSDNRLPFILITLAAIVWLVCLPLFQDGMFMDGVQYAAVARNLAKGIGTFWFPVFSENFVAGLNSFHEHPPLVYFLQSFFFKIFGLHNIYPERIYDLFMLLLTAWFMILIWKQLFKNNESVSKHYWLPVLLWVIMPVVFWSFANNIHELTMGVFTTAAIYFFLPSTDNNQSLVSKSFALIAGGASIVAAFLCKCVPGLFPLAFFGIYYITFRKISFQKSAISTLIVVAILGVSALAILAIPEAKASLRIWFFDRMMHRISNNPVAGSHFHILKGLITEQLPAIAIVLLIFIFSKFKRIENNINKNALVFLLLIGLSASLPLMITKVQRDFYFIPALPFFAMAWATLVATAINTFAEKLSANRKLWIGVTAIAALLFFGGILTTYLKAGNIKRHKAQLEDVYSLKKMLPAETTVCVPEEIMWHDWSFRCYMMRYNDIAFTREDTCAYYINSIGKEVTKYSLVESLQQYNLYYLEKY